MTARIEITKESGEIIHTENFQREEDAHDAFNDLEKIRHPEQYLGMTMNLSESHTGGTIGWVRLIAVSKSEQEYVRRELYRNP